MVGALHEECVSLGIAGYAIKGLAARRWYPEPHLRDFSDFDVWVQGDQEAWRLASWLRARGFAYDPGELPWYKKDERRGLLCGQIILQRPLGRTLVRFDIHFGAYSVRHCALVPLAVAEREPGLAFLPEGEGENAALLVANAAGDHFVTIKDLNDLYLCHQRRDIDWAWVEALLEEAGR